MEVATTITPEHKTGGKRVVLLIVALAIGITAIYFSPARTWLRDPNRDLHRVHAVVSSLGLWRYPAAVMIVAALVSCGVPRLLLCTIAGALFHFWGGLLVGEFGTVLGYYGLFLFIRWGGREWALHRWPKLHKWADLARDQGIVGVILLRQMPIHGTLTNLGLGLSRIHQRQFVIGTAIGVIPESIPAILVGSAAGKGSAKAIIGWLGIAAVVFAIVWLVCGYALKRMRSGPGAADLIAEEAALRDDAQAEGGS